MAKAGLLVLLCSFVRWNILALCLTPFNEGGETVGNGLQPDEEEARCKQEEEQKQGALRKFRRYLVEYSGLGFGLVFKLLVDCINAA